MGEDWRSDTATERQKARLKKGAYNLMLGSVSV